LVASTYFALGPDALAGQQRFLDTHYAHLTAEGKARIGDAIRLTSDDAVRQSLKQFESIGADEVLLVPTIPSLDQVHRLADLV
jgi:hypothetical protein